MDQFRCRGCENAYNKRGHLPRILSCSHAVCTECVDNLLKTDRGCPICGTIQFKLKAIQFKHLEEYPKDYKLLQRAIKLSKNEFPFFQQLGPGPLADKENVLISREQCLNSTINKRISLQKETIELSGRVNKFLNLYKEENDDQIETLNSEVEKYLEKLNDLLIYEIVPNAAEVLQLGKRGSFIDVMPSLKSEQVFACEIDIEIGYRFGEIKLDCGLYYVHSMTSNFTPELGTKLVLLSDMKNEVSSMNRIKPFIQVGDQKLLFTLTDEFSYATYQLIRFCTGEAGRVLKKSETLVSKLIPKGTIKKNSQKLSCCTINVPNARNRTGYDHMFKLKDTSVSTGKVVIQCFTDEIKITRVPKQGPYDLSNVVGELHEGFVCDFKEMKDKVVVECGVAFDFNN